MRRPLVLWAFVVLRLALANGQETQCRFSHKSGLLEIDGILGENDEGVVCCPLECGQCGGQGCGKAGDGNKACCVNGVLQNQPHCVIEGATAPCVFDRFSSVCDPTPCPENAECSIYLSNGRDLAACRCLPDYELIGSDLADFSWSEQGGGGMTCSLIDPCSTDPCGDNSVCEVYKFDSDDTYDKTEALAACSCEEGYENTGPSYEPGDIACTSTGEGPVCDGNGVPGFQGENDNGVVCCPVGCNGCGGARCGRIGAAAGLDNKACCINGVLNNHADCPDNDMAAPCVIVRS